MNTAADAAGFKHHIINKSGEAAVTRETAAALLDQIIDVPYSHKVSYKDVKSGPYLPSIEVIATSGLIKGFSETPRTAASAGS